MMVLGMQTTVDDIQAARQTETNLTNLSIMTSGLVHCDP